MSRITKSDDDLYMVEGELYDEYNTGANFEVKIDTSDSDIWHYQWNVYQ